MAFALVSVGFAMPNADPFNEEAGGLEVGGFEEGNEFRGGFLSGREGGGWGR